MTIWIVDQAHPTVVAVGNLAGGRAYRVTRSGPLFRPETLQQDANLRNGEPFWWDYGARFDTLAEAQRDAEDHAASAAEVEALCRTDVNPRRASGFLAYTPWGAPDHITVFGPGVVFYSTPSHGGFKVIDGLNDAMPAELRNADGWYEEDSEAAKVALAFPHLFSARERATAQRTWDHWLSPAGRARHETEMAKWQASVRASAGS